MCSRSSMVWKTFVTAHLGLLQMCGVIGPASARCFSVVVHVEGPVLNMRATSTGIGSKDRRKFMARICA
jgi:hypothetical protein